jgi:hypothetical protein
MPVSSNGVPGLDRIGIRSVDSDIGFPFRQATVTIRLFNGIR